MSDADRTFLTTRLLPYPRERVFAACADPAQVAVWWGPHGFTSTIDVFDFRPGGLWTFTMHGPDGAAYPQESEFIEIVPPGRIVFVHHRPMHRFETTMTFVEEPGGTRLTWRMVFDDVAEAERLRAFIPAANEQNFDRLAAHLDGAAR